MTRVKHIPGWPGYGITENGNVYSFKSKKFLKAFFNKQRKRKIIDLCLNGKSHQQDIIVLLLITFKGPRPEGHEASQVIGRPGQVKSSDVDWVPIKSNPQRRIRRGVRL